MRVVLVTGGCGGIGAALCAGLADQGWTVVSADVAGSPDVELDVRDAASWAAAIASVRAGHGRLDGLVNNAGVLGRGSVLDLDPDVYDEVVAVNQRGCFLGIRAAAPLMIASGGGSIVTMSSVTGLAGGAGLLAYTATKWAVRGITRSAAAALGPHGIRVNAVLPGAVEGGMAQHDPDPHRAAFVRSLPVPRSARHADVLGAVAFLLGPTSSYLTGTDLVLDGGLSAVTPMPSRD